MTKKKKYLVVFFFMAVIFLSHPAMTAEAKENSMGDELKKELEEIEEEISLDEIDHVLKNSSLKSDYSFTDMVKLFINGNLESGLEQIGQALYQCFLGELSSNKKNVIQIVLIAILSALFTNLATGFLSSSLQETGFFAVYLTMTGVVLHSFFLMISITEQTLAEVFAFLEALIPAYAIAITMVSGSASSIALYEVTFLVMKGCQWALQTILMPLIEIYMLVGVVNYLGESERFTYMGELLKKGVEQMLKWSLGIIVGINLIQNMILPAVDSVKSNLWQKGLSAIPGAGPVISLVTGSLLGSSVLIKNSIGAGGLMILILLCAVPIVKLLILMISFYLCAAFLQPISDKD